MSKVFLNSNVSFRSLLYAIFSMRSLHCLRAVDYFRKAFHHRCLVGFSIPLCYPFGQVNFHKINFSAEVKFFKLCYLKKKYLKEFTIHFLIVRQLLTLYFALFISLHLRVHIFQPLLSIVFCSVLWFLFS